MGKAKLHSLTAYILGLGLISGDLRINPISEIVFGQTGYGQICYPFVSCRVVIAFIDKASTLRLFTSNQWLIWSNEWIKGRENNRHLSMRTLLATKYTTPIVFVLHTHFMMQTIKFKEKTNGNTEPLHKIQVKLVNCYIGDVTGSRHNSFTFEEKINIALHNSANSFCHNTERITD